MTGPIRSRERAVRVSQAYAGMLLTVHFLFLPYGGYERMMEGKYVCFLLLTGAYLAAEALTLPPGVPGWIADLLPAVTPPAGAPPAGTRPAGAHSAPSPLRICAVLYLAMTAASAAISPYGAAVLLGGPRRDGLLTAALYVLSYLALTGTLRRTRGLLTLTAISAVLCDVLVLLQLSGRDPLDLYPAGLGYWDGDTAYTGFFAGTAGNIDFTAFLLALAVSVLLAAAVREGRWLLAPPAALTVWTLIRLDVAGAWAGLAFALLWMPALLFPRRRRALLCLSALLTLAAPLLLAAWRPGQSETLSQAARLLRGEWDGSFGSGRLNIWRDCLPLVREYPLLGGGPGTFYLRGVEPFTWIHDGVKVPSDITAAHNEYLHILVDGGGLSLLAYLGLLGGTLIRCFRRSGTPRFAVCGAGLLCYAAMAAFSVSTCVTAPFVWLLLAAAQPDEIDG